MNIYFSSLIYSSIYLVNILFSLNFLNIYFSYSNIRRNEARDWEDQSPVDPVKRSVAATQSRQIAWAILCCTLQPGLIDKIKPPQIWAQDVIAGVKAVTDA